LAFPLEAWLPSWWHLRKGRTVDGPSTIGFRLCWQVGEEDGPMVKESPKCVQCHGFLELEHAHMLAGGKAQLSCACADISTPYNMHDLPPLAF